MTFLGLKGLLLFVSLTLATCTGETPLQQNDAKQEQQRELQEAYNVPFSITWMIAIGNGGTDRQPTQQEYNWVVEATENWFTDIIEEEYADTDGLELNNVNCSPQPDQTSWTEGADPFPHTVFIRCMVNWQATSPALVPGAVDMLVTLNANYPVRDFIVDYLLTTGTDSVFHFSQRVSYVTNSDPSGGPPGGTTPGQGPSPGTGAPQPTPAPGTFSDVWLLPFKMEFNLATSNSQDRQPTEEEYEGFQVAVQAWLRDGLQSAYSDITTFFMSDILSSITSSNWDATQNFQHNIQMDAYAVFNANSRGDIPSLAQFFATLRTDDVTLATFLSDYVRFAQPVGSIFRSTSGGQYSSEQNGPIVSAGSTGPPSVPSPTPPPVRATPAPANSNNIIATIPTESNWTYTIGGFGIEDREPTQEEYLGLVESTHEWLSRIYNDYYNVNNQDQNLPKFIGVETSLVQGIYRPTEDPPHLVIMKFDFTFEVDANDETEVVPFIDAIFDVIEEADLNQYVFLYVHTSEPIETSVFHGVNSVNWIYSVQDYTYVPRPTRPPSQMEVPGEGVPGDTMVDRARFENAIGVPVSLKYRYRLVDNSAYGAPTEEEWEGVVEATRNFWIATLTAEFDWDPDADFVYVDAKWDVDSTTYTGATAEADFPYEGRMLAEIMFTEGSTPPGAIALRTLMSGLIPGSNLIGTHLREAMPVNSLFRTTLEIRWDY